MEKSFLRHIVFYKLKEGIDEKEITEVESIFKNLKSKIPLIMDLEMGSNVSPEGKDMGFTHAYVTTFKNEEDRDAYLIHTAHKEAALLFAKAVDKICVVDYLV